MKTTELERKAYMHLMETTGTIGNLIKVWPFAGYTRNEELRAIRDAIGNLRAAETLLEADLKNREDKP